MGSLLVALERLEVFFFGSTMQAQGVIIAYIVVFGLLGVVQCFFGWRLCRPLAVLAGALFSGGVMGALAAVAVGGLPVVLLLGALGVAAGCFIAWQLPRVGTLFYTGCMGGLSIWLLLQLSGITGVLAGPVALLIYAGILGALGALYQRPGVTAVSAVWGGGLVVAVGSYLLSLEKPAALLFIWLIVALAGAAVQLLTAPKEKEIPQEPETPAVSLQEGPVEEPVEQEGRPRPYGSPYSFSVVPPPAVPEGAQNPPDRDSLPDFQFRKTGGEEAEPQLPETVEQKEETPEFQWNMEKRPVTLKPEPEQPEEGEAGILMEAPAIPEAVESLGQSLAEEVTEETGVTQEQSAPVTIGQAEEAGLTAAGPEPEGEASRVCPGCGKANPGYNRFCSGCGLRLPRQNRCPACASAMNEGDRFCGICGYKLEGNN